MAATMPTWGLSLSLYFYFHLAKFWDLLFGPMGCFPLDREAYPPLSDSLFLCIIDFLDIIGKSPYFPY